jgi:hypothetical protein
MGQSWSQPRDTERIAQDRHRIVDAAIFHKGACPTQSILRSTLGAREENHRLLRLRAATGCCVCGQPTHQKRPSEPEEILTRSLIPT